jgi:hypothetical protein
MKRKMLLLTVLLSLCLPGLLMAAPWLTCDPMTDEVVEIQLNLNGQQVDVDTAVIQKTATAWYLLDLSSIAAGSYTVTGKADYGLWGWSTDSVPLDFVKPVLGTLENVNISP